ncbi:MAG: serine hydrolase [Ignavibacterium sp.]|jgi:CubicO group peptidase (beta-lactamase class C family)|uniref:serine hydrolase n=1 Tax=Ignavibacterium sp. TaxID=2651167 RepID=UPI00329999BF
MKNIKITLVFTLVLLIDCFSQTIPTFITDSLDTYVNRGLQQWQIPGAAILIVKDGQIVVAKGYGVKELGTNDKVDANTLFMIGSNTKAFTGTALALLEQDGKLNLEDKVVKYLPDFKMKDEWVTQHLNLLDIVSHRMGLETFQGDFMYWTSDLTADEVIQKFGMLTPKYDFRTKYGYTNAGYAIAGKVIEKVSGLTWADFLKEKIFKPLEMDRTVPLSVDFMKADNIARPHTFVDGKMSVIPIQNIDNLAPCGSIGSSITDLSHWIIAQLDSGKYNKQNVIPFSVIQKTRQLLSIERRVRHPYNKTHYSLYGMGWAFQDYEGREMIMHTGGVNGFVTSVTLIPEEKLGVVVLTNTDQNAFFQSLKWEIIDAYLGLPYRNYDSSFYAGFIKRQETNNKWLKEVRDSVAMNIKPELSLTEFEGKYKHEVYGFAELKKVNDKLELTLEHHSKLKAKLEYIGNNRFLCTYSDPTYGIKVFSFEIENGKVKSFDLYVDDFIDYEAYKFVKQ